MSLSGKCIFKIIYIYIFRISTGKDGTLLFSIFSFYGIRAIIQANFMFRYTRNMYWVYPGFPSLVVPYGDGSDFYYSGHTGFMLLSVLYLFKYGYKVCAYIGVGILIVVIQVLFLFEVHYTIGNKSIF